MPFSSVSAAKVAWTKFSYSTSLSYRTRLKEKDRESTLAAAVVPGGWAEHQVKKPQMQSEIMM